LGLKLLKLASDGKLLKVCQSKGLRVLLAWELLAPRYQKVEELQTGCSRRRRRRRKRSCNNIAGLESTVCPCAAEPGEKKKNQKQQEGMSVNLVP
jgi:hypothetical protein